MEVSSPSSPPGQVSKVTADAAVFFYTMDEDDKLRCQGAPSFPVCA